MLFFNSRTACSSLLNHQLFANPSLRNLDLKKKIIHNILLNKFTFSASATAFCLADVSKAVWAGQWHHFLLLLPLDKINCRRSLFCAKYSIRLKNMPKNLSCVKRHFLSSSKKKTYLIKTWLKKSLFCKCLISVLFFHYYFSFLWFKKLAFHHLVNHLQFPPEPPELCKP